MVGKALISRFTPSRTPPEVLEAIFVQRQALLADSLERIEESATTGNKHHLLFVGPRGCGKTHLVALINHRTAALERLKNELRIAWLNEDESSISFLDLLIRIYRALAERYPDEFPPDDLEALFGLPEARALDRLKALLLAQLDSHTLLVLVENLDEVFEGLGEQGQMQWRAFLQEHPVTVTVATAQQLFEGVSRRRSPFFGFFQVRHLKPLSIEQATELLQHIARYHADADLARFVTSRKGRARVEAVYHLSGGNHRVYIVLSEFISREALDELVGAFEKMLDELTPYYQERLRWLSPQQRKIVQHLCRVEAPVSVKDIARHLFMTHQTTSGQLKELRDKGYVTSHSRGRESLYELAEPLMRLCVEVKENDHQPIRLIIRFLRAWYSGDQLSRLYRQYAEHDMVRDYLAAAMNYPLDKEVKTALLAEPAEEDEALIHFRRFTDFYDQGDIHSAVKEMTAIIETAKVTVEQKAKALVNRGFAYDDLGKTENAIADYTAVHDMDTASAEQKAKALVNRGILYSELSRIDKAFADYNTVLNMNDAPNRQKARALVNRGVAYKKLGQIDGAIADYTTVLAIDDMAKELKAGAYINLGAAYDSLHKYEQALDCADNAIQLAPDQPYAYFNRAEALLHLGRWQDAWKALEDALERFPPAESAYAGDIAAMIGIVAASTSVADTWTARVRKLAELYRSAGALSYLGTGLVQSLASTSLRDRALASWQTVWETVCADDADMRIPLRIFGTGCRYLQTRDARVRFDLVMEDRRVLEAVLLQIEAES